MDATEAQEAAPLASESNAHLVPLVSALEDFPTELMQRLIPADRAIMLGMVSKEVRAAIGRVKPAARVKARRAAAQPAGAGASAGQEPERMMPSVGASMVSARALQTALIKPIALVERGLGNLQ